MAPQNTYASDLHVPVSNPVRIHSATGNLGFPGTMDHTSSPVLLFLDHCVPTHRKTVRKPFRKPFLYHSLMPVIRDIPDSSASACRHGRCKQFGMSTSLCLGNSSGVIERSVPVEEDTGLDRPSDRFSRASISELCGASRSPTTGSSLRTPKHRSSLTPGRGLKAKDYYSVSPATGLVCP